jgi:ABC-type transporter Mla subunit MlaD
MAVGTNRWKLGLFVIVGFALVIAAIIVLGAQHWNDRTVAYYSFFDESVQGLDLGSPVKYRGVTIGRVAAIDVAPDHRHVQVTSELSLAQLDHAGLHAKGREKDALAMQPKLRVQLSQTGITGVKFILLDFFETSGPPEPPLPFKTPPNTILTTPSTMKNLEDSVTRAANQFPDIASALLGTVSKLNALMDNVEEQRLPERAAGTLGDASSAMKELNAQLAALHAGELAAHAQQSLTELNQTLASVNHILQRMDSDQGLMRSAERAANSVNEVARGAQTVGPELELTLRDMRGAARSVKRFVDELERDPDMLLKGKAAASR